MDAAIATAICLVGYALGYLVYSRFLAERVFELRPNAITPAHRLNDGVDYVPTKKWVLFGHHYASIAGLAPMLGPAVAVIWGWLPAMLWVVLGSVFVGCVHDFAAVVVSVRAGGKSIGKVAESIIGRRAMTLFHLIIFFLVALGMGVFVYVIAFLFSPAPTEAEAAIHFPQAVIPSFGLMGIAAVVGWLTYRRGMDFGKLAVMGFLALIPLIIVSARPAFLASTGLADPAVAPGKDGWSWVLIGYAFVASVLPVWSLLQPRDFLNSLLLYIGLTGLYLGVFVGLPEFDAPMVNMHPEGAPSMIPFVFIVIACGAASGFHSLVSSGTTAKQLDSEMDARAIGYGGMIGESLLGLIAVLATTAGMASEAEWSAQYSSWGAVQGLGAKVGGFINGASTFLEALGIDRYTGASFISLVVVSYALTSLDSATRLLRYNIEEMADNMGFSLNRYVSSLLAVIAIAFFAFYEIEGKPAGLSLWALFGTTNQLLAGLALLTVTLYLLQRGKPWYYTGVPMILLLAATLFAMVSNIQTFYEQGTWPLFGVGVFLLILAVWLVVEAGMALNRHWKRGIIESLDLV